MYIGGHAHRKSVTRITKISPAAALHDSRPGSRGIPAAIRVGIYIHERNEAVYGYM